MTDHPFDQGEDEFFCKCGKGVSRHKDKGNFVGVAVQADNDDQVHECVFVEEQGPSGRVVLGPCLTCNLSAMDALEGLRKALQSIADKDPSRGFDMVATASRALGEETSW